MNVRTAESLGIPERGNCYSAVCPAREVLGHVTGRWGGLVLAALLERTHRFSELRTRIEGISEKMLAQTLRDLERDGLLVRRSFHEVPPRVDYTLTPAGREVGVRLASLVEWIQAHTRDVVAAQMSHEDRRRS